MWVRNANGCIVLGSSMSQEVSKYVVLCGGALPPVPIRRTPAVFGCSYSCVSAISLKIGIVGTIETKCPSF